jgi:hypothetical protein
LKNLLIKIIISNNHDIFSFGSLQKQLEEIGQTNLNDVYKDIIFGVYNNTDIIQNLEISIVLNLKEYLVYPI